MAAGASLVWPLGLEDIVYARRATPRAAALCALHASLAARVEALVAAVPCRAVGRRRVPRDGQRAHGVGLPPCGTGDGGACAVRGARGGGPPGRAGPAAATITSAALAATPVSSTVATTTLAAAPIGFHQGGCESNMRH